jgi:C_GCAxxG_C_C family probable redox protein
LLPPERKRMNAAAERAYELGYEYEATFGACSQCTILAIMDGLEDRNPELFRAAFGFAGGMGDLSETCGALAAGIMMIGHYHGRRLEHVNSQSEDQNRHCLQMVRDLHDRFVGAYGSIRCADIHMRIFGRTFDQWDQAEFAEFLRLGGHVDKCTAVVGNAARWTVEILSAVENDEPERID